VVLIQKSKVSKKNVILGYENEEKKYKDKLLHKSIETKKCRYPIN